MLEQEMQTVLNPPLNQKEPVRDAKWYFWKFVHNTIIHPILGLPWDIEWANRAHDWTAERCYGGG
jgi:hypothetical protein